MAIDDENLSMHAVLKKCDMGATTNGPVYKLGFEIPIGFVEVVGAVATVPHELWWNDVLVAERAVWKGIKARPVRDSDPEWVVSYEALMADAERANIQTDVDKAGDFRIHVLQASMGLSR